MGQYRCPNCKKEGPFDVSGRGWCDMNLVVDSDGCVDDYSVDEVQDYEHDGDSYTYCRDCGHHEDWFYFDVDNQEDDDEEDREEQIEELEDDIDDIERKDEDELLRYIDQRLGGK